MSRQLTCGKVRPKLPWKQDLGGGGLCLPAPT